MFWDIILYSFFIIPLLYVLRKSLLSLVTPRGIKGIPAYPNPRPFTGDLGLMGKAIKAHSSFSHFFDQISQDLGPISQVRASFFMNFVVLADLPEIESILLRPTGTFDRSIDTIRVFKHILPSALLSLRTDETYKHHRRVIGPAMTSKYLSMTAPKAAQAAKSLVDYWKVKVEKSKGKAFAAETDMESATMDAICGMAFGHSLDIVDTRLNQIQSENAYSVGPVGEAVFTSIDPPVARAIYAIFGSLPIQAAFPAISHFFTRLTPSYRAHAKTLDTFLNLKIEESRAWARQLGGDAAADLADNTLHMMVARELKGDDAMDVSEMKDEVFQYLLAGTETSATTLAWFVKYMTNCPEIQYKLRSHVLERFPEIQDRPPAFEDLNAANLPYLEAVVQETLRLSRTAGGYSRQVMQDTTILGKFIPKGTVIIMSTNTSYEDRSTPSHRRGPIPGQPPAQVLSQPSSPASTVSSVADSDDDEAVKWDRAQASVRHETASRKVGYWRAGTGLEFDPSRWLDQDGNFDANSGPSLPFSAGQRGCFGKNLALLELRMFIAMINQAFFFAPIAREQNGFARNETVTSHPVQSFVRPVNWDSAEARV